VRNRTLRDTDFAVPSQVLAALNLAFPMEEQSGKYFTMIYAVFNTQTRELIYATGGHPPALAVSPDGTVEQLRTSGMMIGALPFARYTDQTVTLAPGTRLFVFSDGCYEVFSPDKRLMSLEEFAALLAAAAPHPDTLDRTLAACRDWQQRDDFDDDFSLVELRL